MENRNENKIIKKVDNKIRSEFATIKMTGAGPHKSDKEYDRSKNKKIIEADEDDFER